MEMFKYYFNTAEKVDKVLSGPIDKATMKSVLFHLIWHVYYNISTDDQDIINYIESWMQGRTYTYHLASYARDIKNSIRTVKKLPWRNIQSPIEIRQSELDYISSFNDIRKEKLLFCYLAIAKFNDASRDVKTHWESESDAAIFKMARVNIPAAERDFFIYDLIYQGVGCSIYMNNKDDDTSKRIDFVSDDENDPVVLLLSENNYRELAFTYLNWKNGGGYKECKSCGRLFKVRTNNKYCKKCTPEYEKIEYKKIVCIDCGEEVVIDGNSNRKIRCDACQHQKQLEYQRISMQKARNVK